MHTHTRKPTPRRLDNSGQVDLFQLFAELVIMTASRCLLGEEIRAKLDESVADLYHDLDRGFTPVCDCDVAVWEGLSAGTWLFVSRDWRALGVCTIAFWMCLFVIWLFWREGLGPVGVAIARKRLKGWMGTHGMWLF